MHLRDRIPQLRSALGTAKLVAVTKGRSPEDILTALKCGVTDIGENRVQEAMEKFAQLHGNPLFDHCTKHFIGHVQSNKAKRVAELFDVVQSVDSSTLAQKLSAAAAQLGKTLLVYIEVNATGESQKHGIQPDVAPALAAQIRALPNLKLVGIMGMGPQGTQAEIRICFSTLKQIQRQLNLPELSVGMSADYPLAIAEGSTMVRIGTALFGAQNAVNPT